MSRILIIWFLSVGSVVFSQGFKFPDYTISSGGSFSTGSKLPFLMLSNQHGKNTVKPAEGFVDAGFETKTDSSGLFDYNYGLELYDRFDGNNDFWMHQAYISARYRFICLRAGLKEDNYGNQDSLSIGSVLWSNNARPLPQIVIGTNGYVDVPFTKGYLQVSGLLSHGWFGNDGYIKHAYLHHKNLFIKLGGKFPVNISYGLEHYAQWGGTDPVKGPLPSGWDAYKRIFTARDGNSNDPATPGTEIINRLGNHLGSRQYDLDIKLKKIFIKLYYQTIFEDNSGKKKYFMRDGLWGFALKNRSGKIFNNFLYEFFNSTYQSGGIKYEEDGTIVFDNYLNNSLYQSGWTYHDFTIGIPMITSPAIMHDNIPGIKNNRVRAHYLACEGIVSELIIYTLEVSFSQNYGTFYHSYPKTLNSTSAVLKLRNDYSHTKGFEIELNLAFDFGKMYGNNAGFCLVLRKHGII